MCAHPTPVWKGECFPFVGHLCHVLHSLGVRLHPSVILPRLHASLIHLRASLYRARIRSKCPSHSPLLASPSGLFAGLSVSLYVPG